MRCAFRSLTQQDNTRVAVQKAEAMTSTSVSVRMNMHFIYRCYGNKRIDGTGHLGGEVGILGFRHWHNPTVAGSLGALLRAKVRRNKKPVMTDYRE